MGHNLEAVQAYVEFSKDRHLYFCAFFAQLMWKKYVKKYSGVCGSGQSPLAGFV
jgi:hypothetical protein